VLLARSGRRGEAIEQFHLGGRNATGELDARFKNALAGRLGDLIPSDSS
jgi:hypothetical protein